MFYITKPKPWDKLQPVDENFFPSKRNIKYVLDGEITDEYSATHNNNFYEFMENRYPNKNGDPMPVKKVRIRENIGGAEQLKTDINQHVNLRNHHHVLIYKDEKGALREDVVTFWTAVERKKQKQPVFQLPEDGVEIITTLQINNMFLLGLNEESIDWNNPDYELLKKSLNKIQTLSTMFYEFWLHSDSTQVKDTNSNVFKRIQSFGKGKSGWLTLNPIKVKISPTGKIEKT